MADISPAPASQDDALCNLVLKALSVPGSEITEMATFAEQNNVDLTALSNAVKRLTSQDMVVTQTQTLVDWVLTPEGEEGKAHESAEFALWREISDDGIDENTLDETKKHAMNYLKAQKLVSFNKATKRCTKVPGAQFDRDVTHEMLVRFATSGFDLLSKDEQKDAQKRKLIEKRTRKQLKIMRGPAYVEVLKPTVPFLTKEMLASGKWEEVNFKPLKLDAVATHPAAGHLHPLMKYKSMVRRIFISLGFQEMPTSRFVESSLWNFDALFQPQAHPCRDMQDTFFMKDPAMMERLPEGPLVERIKRMHEQGGCGSIGSVCGHARVVAP